MASTKKKKIPKQSFSEWAEQQFANADEETRKRLSVAYQPSNDIAPITTTTKAKDTDIAPVKTTTERKYAKGGSDFDGNNKVSEGNTKKRTWFNTSAFDDGYQLFDVSKSIGATIGDIAENIIVGSGELAERGLEGTTAFLSAMFESQQLQNAATEMAYKEMKGEDSTELLKSRMKPVEAVKEKTAAFVAEDSWNSEKAVKESAKKILGVDLDEYSLMGEKLDSALQSVPQVAASASAEAVGVPWFLVSGMTAYGGELENALNQGGASWEEANLSAGVSASGEILTEMLSGGISFGGKTLDDVLTKQVATKIASKFWQKAAQLGLDVTGEAVEEWISADIGAFGQWLTYRSDEELTELLGSEEAMDAKIEAAIGGGLLGGVSNIGKAVKGKVTGVDSVTGLTKNEEAIVEKVVKEKVAEQEKAEKKKLTAKEKNKIRLEVKESLERGEISTDTIEEILGGEDYKRYKAEEKRQEEIKTELDKLRSMKASDRSDYQTERMEELKTTSKTDPQMLETLKFRSEESIRKALEADRKRLGKNRTSYLDESYAEKERRGNSLRLNLDKYEGKQKEMLKGIMEKNLVNNTRNTREYFEDVTKAAADKGLNVTVTTTKEILEMVEKEKGKEWVEEHLKGKTPNAYILKDGTIAINVNSKGAKYSVFGHEIGHTMEKELSGDFREFLYKYAEAKEGAEAFAERRATLEALYEGGLGKVDIELTNDLLGEYIYNDKEFVRRLSVEHRNIFQKALDKIKYLYKMATAGSQRAKDLLRLQKMFEDIYRESGKYEADTEAENSSENEKLYSISKTSKIPYNDQVKQIEGGKMNGSNSLYIGKPSEQLQTAGFSDAPFAMNQSDYRKSRRKSAKNTKYSSHGVPYDFFENMPEYMAESPILIDNGVKISVVTSYGMKDTKGKDSFVIAGVWRNQAMERDTINQVKSVYPLDDFAERITKAAESKNLVVTNKNKAEQMLVTIGIQPSEVSHIISLAKSTITQPEADVKGQFSLSAEQSDADYMDAVKRGDTETARMMVDEAAKKAGVKYSLSDTNTPTTADSMSEMMIDRDIAPTKEDSAKPTEDIAPLYNVPESAPMTEEDAEAMARESLANITDAEAPDIVADDGTVPRETAQLPNTKVVEIAKHLREKLGLSNRQMAMARGLIEEYSKNDALSRDDLYETIKAAFGTQTKADDYVALRNEAREFIRNLKINVPKEMQSDIPDFDKKRRSMARKIKFSEDGQGIDELYKNDLQPNFPKLFGDETQGDAEKFDELYDVLTNDGTEEVDLPDETLQSAADIIVNEVADYRQKWTQKLAESAARQPIDQSQIPVTAEEYNSRVDKLYDSLSTKPIDRLQKAGAYTFLIRRGDDGSAYFVIQKNGVGIRKQIEDASNMSDAQLWRYASEMAVDTEMPYQMEESGEVKEYDPQKEKLERSLRSIDKHLETDKKLLDEEFEIRRQDAQSEYDNYALDEEYKRRLKELEDTAQTKRQNAKIANQRMTKQEQISKKVKELVGDISTWVDKKLGLSYKTNTLRRNLRDIVRDSNGKKDIARADAIYDYLQGTYNVNEAKMNRELARIKKAYADMKISKAESTYIQMLGEFRHNPETTLTKEQVDDYLKKHKNSIDEKKVDKAIEMARKTYDSLLERVNATLRENGMREIPYRKGYFPHFNEQKQGLGAKFLEKFLNWKTQNDDIPTSIAGLTEQFNPNRSWQSFNKQRKGDTTDYNFLKGMDNYVFGALDWIYHIEDIERRRALENHIRFTHSDEGIHQQIEKIRANEELDADEVQEQIDLVYANANNPLNNFVTDLRAGTNRLANKKSSLDRHVEEMVNRKVYSTLTNISNRVSANMVAGSISSALTNFIPITQSWAEVDPMYSVIAMGDTLKSIVYDDGTVDKSAFLTNRLRQVDNLYQTGWDKLGKAVGFMMEAIDSFTSQVVWRSKYRSNIANKMSENEAIKNADQFAENVMAGRSRGNNPTIFDSKNLLFKTLTAFQLEVNNQYGYMFKDLPQDVKNKSMYNLVKGYTMMFFGAYAYNALYSMMTGRDAAFDPIGIVEDLLRDLGMFDDDEEEEEEVDVVGAVMGLTENVMQEVPFVGGLMGGGRVPISSAIPYEGNVMDLAEGTANAASNVWSGIRESKSLSEIWSDADVQKATDEWLKKPLYYLVSPMGGGQLKKTIEGLAMFNTDEDHPIAGSYTNNGDLRFPVEDTIGSRVKAGIFGQYSSKNAREYFDNDYAPLKEKQIKEYMDVDMPIADYWKYREGLSGLTKLEEKAEYINSLDLTNKQKNILINNIADRKEEIDMTDYDKYADFEEFDYAQKNPEKYEFFRQNGISFKDYDSASKEGKSAYNWAYEYQDKYLVSKTVTDDVVEYKQYTKAINDIEGVKDKYGRTVSGSREKKVLSYINSLDIPRGAKLVLYKNEYKSSTTYNKEIVSYVNGRKDLSKEERITILKELGFTVLADGTVRG